MSERIILDSGPLVAYFDGRDQYHDWAVEQFSSRVARYVTCEAVLAEVDHLLERARAPSNALLEALRSGALEVAFTVANELRELERLKMAYKHVPISLADACLVRMAELDGAAKVMTLDSDFRLYRKHRRHLIPLVSPR